MMLREVDLPVMLIVDLSLASVVLHSPFLCHAFAYTGQVISEPELSHRSLRLPPNNVCKPYMSVWHNIYCGNCSQCNARPDRHAVD